MMSDQYDAIVIGGGIIGASIAWRLARNNLRVLLLDAGKIGSEASSAAAGMLAPGGEFEHPSPQLDFAISSLASYPQFIAALQADSGLAVEFRPTPAVQIAFTPAELASIAARADSQRAAGIVSNVLGKPELRTLVPLVHPDAVGAVQYSCEAIVDPAALMIALRAACLAQGVSIAEHSRVLAISANHAAARVSLADRSINSRFAILAAGAWTVGIPVTIDGEAYALPKSFPVKGHLLGYRLPAGSLRTTVRHHHTYVLQRADGFTIAGSSTENVGFDRTIDPPTVADIAARASTSVPALASLQPESAWIGFRPGIESPAPNIGQVQSSRLWLAYGHYRNGILLAPATCDRISQEICAVHDSPERRSIA